MDHVSRFNVAMANPEVFACSTFNIFEQDVWSQVRMRQANGPVIETRETWPLLYTAIENDIDIQAMAQVIRIYATVYPDSIDGIWGTLTAIPPPIVFAAGLGKPEIVTLLLDEGADAHRRCSARLFNPNLRDSGPCTLRDFNHAECQPRVIEDHRCTTVLRAASRRATRYAKGSIEHQAAEECALILYRRGLLEDQGQIIVDAVHGQFDRFLREVVDLSLTLNRGQQNQALGIELWQGLQTACMIQPHDNDRTLIDYLVGAGAPLIDPRLERLPEFRATGVNYLISRNHPKTAVFLLNCYADQGVLLDYSPFYLVRGEYALPYVQGLYRLMSQPNQTLGNVRVSSRQLHGLLLKKSMNNFESQAVQWLVEQGRVGSVQHIHHAITMGNRVALRILVEAGHPVNGTVELHRIQRTPLELALMKNEFDMAIFLINQGANPRLLRDSTRHSLLAEYSRQFPWITFSASKNLLNADMLQPSFFTTDDEPRRMALFHYIIDPPTTS
ncbi:hypothetical protein O1611_g8125 [Lasiodiplodia mahajangana]|uniref:Uncharacterized protein n=1 Tax=Lasiodiplodia mahajangana TaxID=1108764 RepID=A0ACC2JDQ5_9PEZI|nr:hypothetical protein O1611_g8125 [Lasiodiplodia mahajangana]